MKIIVRAFTLGLILWTWTAYSTGKSDMSLEQELKAKADESAKKMPADKKKVMSDAIDELRKSRIVDKVPKAGETFPDFTLLNAQGKPVQRKDVLKKGRVIITFYRGGWCPYCSIQLHAFQKEMPKIKALGADLIAVSPELPDNSMSTQEKNKLEFMVLSDHNQDLARKLNIVYTLSDPLQKLYSQLNIDLPKANGQKTWELPLAATFVVDASGRILYSFAHEDYKIRAPMNSVLKALQ